MIGFSVHRHRIMKLFNVLPYVPPLTLEAWEEGEFGKHAFTTLCNRGMNQHIFPDYLQSHGIFSFSLHMGHRG